MGAIAAWPDSTGTQASSTTERNRRCRGKPDKHRGTAAKSLRTWYAPTASQKRVQCSASSRNEQTPSLAYAAAPYPHHPPARIGQEAGARLGASEAPCAEAHFWPELGCGGPVFGPFGMTAPGAAALHACFARLARVVYAQVRTMGAGDQGHPGGCWVEMRPSCGQLCGGNWLGAGLGGRRVGSAARPSAAAAAAAVSSVLEAAACMPTQPASQ